MSYVPVDSQGTGATRKEAISDALQDAVSQVNGAEIAAEMSSNVKENFSEKGGKEEYSTEQAFQESVKKKTKGVIRSWKLLSEEKEEGFSCIRISGPLEFSLLGILSGISAILADGGISIFAVSTYETDYLLFRSEKIDAVKSLLQKAGHTVSGKPLLD